MTILKGDDAKKFNERKQMIDEELRKNFDREKKSIANLLAINTKPAHRFEHNGYWVLVDPHMPESEFEAFKNLQKDRLKNKLNEPKIYVHDHLSDC